MTCKFCESEPCETWTGNWCSTCRQLKNLCNVYGFPRMLEIMKKCCIRDSDQLENKINNHKEKLKTIKEEIDLDKIVTRSKKL